VSRPKYGTTHYYITNTAEKSRPNCFATFAILQKLSEVNTIDKNSPILRLLDLQLQRQRCSRPDRFSKAEKNVVKLH
jgi:hypothetical protein